MSSYDIELRGALTPDARSRLVEGTGDTWALVPPGTTPVHLSGMSGEPVTLVPGPVFVDAQNTAEDRGRTLALLNARLSQLGVTDPTVRRLLENAGYTGAGVVLDLAAALGIASRT